MNVTSVLTCSFTIDKLIAELNHRYNLGYFFKLLTDIAKEETTEQRLKAGR